MADEAEKPVEHNIPGLTGTPLSNFADAVVDVTTGETKAQDFKPSPVKVARTKTKPSKPEYQPFKW